ncbi:MAG: acyltransferase family protein [Flavobacteriaceae bacterium]|jgi:fucose 4-O-acetylase-like acetyltransferase|nr:acyltransferase family protein [Flavobacteriaceae bacterium]
MADNRIKWIDFIKGSTIFTVMLGHVISGMIRSGYFSDYDFFLETFYVKFLRSFSMPVFFMISGILYSKKRYTPIKDIKVSIVKKGIALGVPYLFFSTGYWMIKYIMGDNVRTPVDWQDLLLIFIKPIGYLWFLYVLFFLYLFIELLDYVFKNNFIVFFIVTILAVIRWFYSPDVFIIERIMQMGIYFYIGKIVVNKMDVFNNYLFTALCVIIFFSLQIINVFDEISVENGGFNFILGCSAAFAIISLSRKMNTKNRFYVYFSQMGQITLPIYLIHPAITSAVRIALLYIGLQNVWIHLILGVIISWSLSIYIYKFAEKYRWLDMIFYPVKYKKIS